MSGLRSPAMQITQCLRDIMKWRWAKMAQYLDALRDDRQVRIQKMSKVDKGME